MHSSSFSYSAAGFAYLPHFERSNLVPLSVLTHSHLHLVDSELDRYRGRERQLLREYEMKYAPTTGSSRTILTGVSNKSFAASFGDAGCSGAAAAAAAAVAAAAVDRRTALQRAHEEETRRVQETIRASVERITARADRRL